MRDNLGIGVRAEAVAVPLQFGTQLGILEDLTVEDHEDAPVLVGHRLAAIRQPDDAQPARCQAQARPLQKAVLVGAAVQQRRCHPAQGGRREWPLSRQVDPPRDAAHALALPQPRAAGTAASARRPPGGGPTRFFTRSRFPEPGSGRISSTTSAPTSTTPASPSARTESYTSFRTRSADSVLPGSGATRTTTRLRPVCTTWCSARSR